jgi:AraC-like DNA-binding protein
MLHNFICPLHNSHIRLIKIRLPLLTLRQLFIEDTIRYAAIYILSILVITCLILTLAVRNISMKLFIKYMVSIRCKMLVKAELENLDLHYTTVELGEVNIVEDITPEQREQLNRALKKAGLELMDDKRAMLVEKIKNVIIEMIHYSDEPPLIKYSVYLSEKLKYDYTYLANLFSEVQGTTIEQFIIIHKIERVKEMLVYDNLNLTEIAHKLHYSSVGHLSNQFKKTTGLTPSHFKKLKEKRLSNLENL